jgi:hypothetical protein
MFKIIFVNFMLAVLMTVQGCGVNRVEPEQTSKPQNLRCLWCSRLGLYLLGNPVRLKVGLGRSWVSCNGKPVFYRLVMRGKAVPVKVIVRLLASQRKGAKLDLK